MSLFPAYEGIDKNENEGIDKKENEGIDNKESEETESEKWLKNSSYTIKTFDNLANQSARRVNSPAPKCDVVSSSDSDNRSHKKNRDKLRKRKHKDKRKNVGDRDVQVHKDNGYSVDKSCEKVFLKVESIARPSRPRYSCMCHAIGVSHLSRSKKKSKWKRYYKHYFDAEPKESGGGGKGEEENDTEKKSESEIREKTACYNERLGRDPNDVDTWLEYVRYQDTVWQFEKTYRKGSTAKGARVTAERKLAILSKGLTKNAGNAALSRERVHVACVAYPADELKDYLQGLVDKDPGNVILWQGYIESIQCSMAHCNAPAVLAMYTSCLGRLHRMRRSSSSSSHSKNSRAAVLEERVLCMLYRCGLFLRQAGLWEQLWTLLRLYLELNVGEGGGSGSLCPTSLSDDRLLLQLEETVLESQLPSHELWLRVERLREACHWLPWDGPSSCEDPQRVVFVDELVDLIHPVTCTDNAFRLVVTVVTLLKVPLLPTRHTSSARLGLDHVPWALDTVEAVLPAFFPWCRAAGGGAPLHHLLRDADKLTVGPQYLRTQPGQEEYLAFLVGMMRSSADHLGESRERLALLIWWLRFERLLVALDAAGRFKMPAGRVRDTRTTIKQFLREEKNRDQVPYYVEYALLEHELGNHERACGVLCTAIAALCEKLKSRYGGDRVIHIVLTEDEDSAASLCALHRALVETSLEAKGKSGEIVNDEARYRALESLAALAEERSITENFSRIDSAVITRIQDKFKHVWSDLLQRRKQRQRLTLPDHFLPDLLTDWTICYGWLLYLTGTPFEADKMLEDTLEALNTQDKQHDEEMVEEVEDVVENDDSDMWRKEVLTEWYVSITYRRCVLEPWWGTAADAPYPLFRHLLHRSLEQFPNNLHMLTLAAAEQVTSGAIGSQWWKLCKSLSKSGHAMPALFLVLIAEQQLCRAREAGTSEEHVSTPIITAHANRVLWLFSVLTKQDMCTRRCGLLWRLYLQFLYAEGRQDACRNTYYAAVEECPWLKSLYIDAAIYIPAELAPIQDLIIEKQLRIHLTPEELDVLRN